MNLTFAPTPAVGASTVVIVTPESASTGALDPNPPVVGSALPVTVTILDQFGNVVTGYQGKVQLSSTDPKATIEDQNGNPVPLSSFTYTFQGSDNGTHTFNITFNSQGGRTVTATDVTNTNAEFVVGTVSLNITPGPVSINWSDPADITYGTALSNTQLDATANIQGKFSYSPAIGTVLYAGQNQLLTVTFTPKDTTDYTTTTATVFVNVNKATPPITWRHPQDITYGTPLSSTQLDATATLPGTFSYQPPAGTVLPLGSKQPLMATFTPADTNDYNVANPTVFINVDSPITLSPTILAIATVGKAYSPTTVRASGGSGSGYSYTLTNNNVTGSGLSLVADAAGVTLSGTPTVAGVYYFVVQATDSANNTSAQVVYD
jgi:hypothetical protein